MHTVPPSLAPPLTQTTSHTSCTRPEDSSPRRWPRPWLTTSHITEDSHGLPARVKNASLPSAHVLIPFAPSQQATHTLQVASMSNKWLSQCKDSYAPLRCDATSPLHTRTLLSTRGAPSLPSKPSLLAPLAGTLSGAGVQAGAASWLHLLAAFLFLSSLIWSCTLRLCCATSTCLANLREMGKRQLGHAAAHGNRQPYAHADI